MTFEIIPKHVQKHISSSGTPALKQMLKIVKETVEENELLDLDAKLEGAEQSLRIVRGFLFKSLQKNKGAESFGAFLTHRNISRRTAYDYIDEANVFEKLSNETQCEEIAKLGALRIRALKTFKAEELSELASGGSARGLTIEAAAKTPAKDLAAIVGASAREAELSRKVKDSETELDTERTNHAATKRKLRERKKLTEFSDAAEEIRREANAISEEIQIRLDELEVLTNDYVTPALLDDPVMARVAITSLNIQTKAIATRAAALDQEQNHRYEEFIGTADEALFTPGEAEHAMKARKHMIHDFDADKSARAMLAESKKPRKRGRPKKSADNK